MSDPQEYTIGWICAIETEYTAAVAFLDEIHTPPDYVSANNRNSYTLGKMSGHNIVIAVRPDGECGPDSATAAAKDMVESFPNVRIGLMVGIGGGAPTAKHDVRLGDIVVGIQHGKTGSVRQYDYGKTMKSRSFQQTGVLISPPAVVLTAVSSLASRYNTAGHEIEASVMAVLERKPRLQQKYGRPPQEIDRLYESELVHPYSSRTCELCCGHRKADIVMRSERGSLAVHYGVIASASQLMRHATIRDIIAKEEGVMCFETEAAGLTDRFPWLIVRGICGYSDSHNNKRWHGYAAITATAYIKDLLTMMVPGQVEQLDPEMPEKQSRIFEWLSAPDPSTNHTKALNKHHGGTGLWFIQGDTFNEWKRLPGSFLWLHGISGCGKTVLTSTIIEHLLRETTCQVLLYFYFDSNDTYKRSLDSLLRSFVIQLCMTGQGASQPLYHLWASHSEGNRQPSTKSLQSILQSMLSGVSNLNIIVDALDESTTRHELLAWLETLVGGSTTSCRLLVTSRREEAIESALQSWTRAEDRVPMQRNEVNKDIRAYIRDRVRNGDEFKRWQQGLDIQEEIEVKLAKNANGIFRWVDRQIRALRYCSDYSRLHATLEDLPRTLDRTYSQILENIPGDHIQQSIPVLRLLTWSQRPLRLEEMVDAIAVDLEASPTFDPRNRSPHPSDIFRLCESLVMLIPVIGVTDGEDQEQNLQVQLAHPSVRQFLLSDRAHAIFGLQMEKSFANAEIAKICLAYLSHVTAHGLSLKDMRSQFPFAQYSATYWSDHARLAEATDDVLLDAVASFFASGNAVFDTCYRLSDPDRPQLSTDDDRVPELLDPLYIASLQGLEQAVERLLERGSDINARCGLYGHPLQAASFAGYHSTVEILLNGGADVNAQGGRYGNALQAASANGHVSITRMLLGMGADVNAQDGDSETLLYGASKKGLEQLVQMFLESGAETDARGGEYGTALQVAALKGYREIVKILVNHGADVHAHLNNHGTALQIAAEVGHGDIVAILLDGEADIMTAGRPGSTLLHAVARNGHTHILKLLISRVSFIGLTDSAGCSLIDIAAQKGHLGVVKLLLDKGVDVSTTDSEGWTPLNRAADEGHLELVKLLIEKGADSEIMNNLGRTPIHSAAKKGHLEVVVFMLDRGVRFNRHGAETSKAVGGASHVGHGETLQVQLARTSSQQEGHSNVASSEFHDSGYSSRQPQPIVDEYGGGESQPFDDDIESVGSVETDIQSSTESLALSNVREAAAREIARAFSGDSEISKLYDEGLKRMDDSGFIKNHRRLLKLFYLEAAKDAEVASHHVILRFLRSRIARIRVSARIIEAKDSPDEELELAMDRSQSLRLINGVLTQADKERDTSRWTEAHRSDLNEQSGVFSGSGEDIWASLTHESPELLADNLDDLEDFDDEDFDDLDANNEEGAVLHVDDLSHVPAIVSMTAFLMDGRAFRIYRNNLQRFAYGKRIAPIALKHALVANDLALAIELLENEPEAVTQSRLGFEWIKEPLALDFTPAEVVRLIIERRKGSSWLDKSGKAIGVGRWGQARELIRGDQPRTLNKLRIITHLAAMDRPAINSAELDDGLPPPSYSRRDLFGVLPWKELIEHLEKRTHAMCLDIWKQGISRVRESMVWFGLILGPLEPGYTRITWKSDMGRKYTSDVKQLKIGGIRKVFGDLERSRGIKIVSMGNTTAAPGNSFWTTLSNKAVQWTSKKPKKTPVLPQQAPVVNPRVQRQRRLSHVQAGDILMICMQRGKRSKNIYQEDLYVRNIDNDQALFVFLRQMFVNHRGALRSYLSLRTMKELKLVEFRLPKNRHPFIPYMSCPRDTCRCLPPEDKILPVGAEYRCTSSGGGGDICPPVPAHVLTDYYENPGSVNATDTWLIELMPKRVCGELEGKSTEPAQGWGISYEEGWDHEKIGLVLLVVFFGGSLLFGLSWTVLRNDIQGAFGVSAWWLSASTILLGYVAIRADDS